MTKQRPKKKVIDGVYARKEKQDDRTLPFEVKYEVPGTKDARNSDRIERGTPSGHIDNYEGDSPPRTPRILQPMDRPAPLQHGVHQDTRDRSNDDRTRKPTVLAAGATCND